MPITKPMLVRAALLSLLEGGMRSVTGLIGKANPSKVSYQAGNATIGIRGTDVNVIINGTNVLVSVANGRVSFTVNGKTTSISAGQATNVDTSKNPAVVTLKPIAEILNALRDGGTKATMQQLVAFGDGNKNLGFTDTRANGSAELAAALQEAAKNGFGTATASTGSGGGSASASVK